jgi:hypothetical protein
MRKALVRILPVLLLAGAAGINLAQSTAPTSQNSHDPSVEPAKVVDGVRSFVLPSIPGPDLPDAPARDVYVANCILCHTQRYVTMQPPFSRKTWTAEVEKMKKAYGAPIADANMPQIVDYLMLIRGK